jgi:hypothetical protein
MGNVAATCLDHFTIAAPSGQNPAPPETLPFVTGGIVMAYAGHFHHVFDAQVARCKKGAPRKRAVAFFRDRAPIDPVDLEFSEYGRNSRFTPGWFILPAVVTGMAVIAAVLLLV